MQSVNKKLGGTLFEGNKVTKLGKYVLPLVNQDIAKYAVIKSVAPKANVRVKEDGSIDYDADINGLVLDDMKRKVNDWCQDHPIYNKETK